MEGRSTAGANGRAPEVAGRIALDEILNRFPEWDVDLANAAFRALAEKVAAQVSVMNARRPPTPKAPIKLDMGV